jgi:hypothetical protein
VDAVLFACSDGRKSVRATRGSYSPIGTEKYVKLLLNKDTAHILPLTRLHSNEDGRRGQ